MSALLQESIAAPLPGGAQLHIRRFHGARGGAPLVMIHGAIENGRIFYSESGKGIAPYLASKGFDVFVVDMRGRGRSTPPIGRGSLFGQTEAITEDIPALIDAVRKIHGDRPLQWVAHSWGGVLLTSFLARFPEEAEKTGSMVYFGSKRTIRVWNIWRILKVDMVWSIVCPLACLFAGYLPARQLHFGSDSETVKSYRQSAEWVRKDDWIDSDDGFDYGSAVQKIKLPPIWYLAAKNDHSLGHPDDVRDFMNSTGAQERRFTILGRKNGNLHDYDHINMLTHPDSAFDHFPLIVKWLQDHDFVKS